MPECSPTHKDTGCVLSCLCDWCTQKNMCGLSEHAQLSSMCVFIYGSTTLHIMWFRPVCSPGSWPGVGWFPLILAWYSKVMGLSCKKCKAVLNVSWTFMGHQIKCLSWNWKYFSSTTWQPWVHHCCDNCFDLRETLAQVAKFSRKSKLPLIIYFMCALSTTVCHLEFRVRVFS